MELGTTKRVVVGGRKITIPDYAAYEKYYRRRSREAASEGCEVCGSKRKLYVFTVKGSSKVHCRCRKHLKVRRTK